MFVCHRELPEHEAKIMTELTLQSLNRLDRVSVIGTFEIALFYQRNWSGRFSLHVIVLSDDQLRLIGAWLRHRVCLHFL